MRVRGVCAGIVVIVAGCSPITARQAHVWEAGGTVGQTPAAADVAVPELAAAAGTLAATPRRIVETALAALDASEPGLDCSMFARRVYAAAGVPLPRTVREQVRTGVPIEPGDLQPGDLVFFAFSRRPVDHVGIYAGSGRVVHVSSSARRVQLADMAAPPFAAAWVASRRPRAPEDPDA